MANQIDLVVGTQVKAQLDALIDHLKALDDKLLESSNLAIKLGKEVPKITTPSGGSNNSGGNAGVNANIATESEAYKKVVASIENYRLRLEALKKTKEGSNSTLLQTKISLEQELKAATAAAKGIDLNAAATRKLEAEKKKLEAQINRANAAAEKEASAYNRTQTQLNKLTAVYNDLSVRKERYNNLTDNEEKRLVTLTRVNEKYNGVLRTTDAAIGKNTRNVGNYASGWNGLSNSINQLTREAPAFANSMQTGFMALSNNIPIFVDELENIRLKNVQLAQSGEKTKSVFSSVAGAFFSWQTALSLGVTLLTIYGSKIIDTIFGLTEAEKAQKKLNDALSEARDTISSEIIQLQSLTKIALDHNESSVNRKLAYDEIKKTLPGLTSATYNQAVSTGDLTIATNLYIASLIQKNIVEAESKSIAEDETKLNKQREQTTKERMGTFKFVMNTITGQQGQALRNSQKAYKKEDEILEESLDKRKKALIKSQEDFLATQSKLNPFLTKLNDKANNDALKKEEERLKNLYELRNANLELDLQRINVGLENENNGFKERFLLLTESNEKRKEIIESDNLEAIRLAKGNDIELLIAKTSYYSKQEKLLVEYNKKRIELIQKQVLKEYKEEKEVIESIKASQQEIIDSKQTGIEQDAEIARNNLKQAEERENQLERLKEATDNWLNSFNDEFLQNSGLGSLSTFFDGTFKDILEGAETSQEKFAVTFNAMAEVAQDVFNKISEASQANFEGEYKRLEAQKEIALKFAGESDFAKERIEEQAEKRRREIEVREFKAKKQQAIFNIAIDTAQAVMATLGKTGFIGIPLSAIVAAIGAIQIGVVAAQKIPQFFEGGTHDGGLMMVNDAKGSNYKETIVTPDGKIIKPEGRDVVMNAPKGTQIFTPEQWQEKELHNMLQSKGISMNESYTSNSGLTYQEMDAILGKHFKNITTQTTTFDKKGFSSYSVSKGNKTCLLYTSPSP